MPRRREAQAGHDHADDADDPPGETFCGGCGIDVRPECRGSLARIGARKVHWECWARCNLACSFCYRTTGTPLSTGQAERLLAAIATSGAETAVFAGGDPSLRQDIGHLLAYAKRLGLVTEVHTNAQFAPDRYRLALAGAVDYVGLSLDGPTAELHDGFRDKPGNFRRVLALLDFLEDAAVPVIVRTVVARPNHREVPDIGRLLASRRNLVSWQLLEFSPVGSGWRNRDRYSLDRPDFDRAVARARRRHGGELAIVARRTEDKTGTYVLVTPDGKAYGTLAPAEGGIYPVVGSMLSEHLSHLSDAIGFRKGRHVQLYQAGERRRGKILATLKGPSAPPED